MQHSLNAVAFGPIVRLWGTSSPALVGSNIQNDQGLPAAIGLRQGEAMQRHRFDVHPHAMSVGIELLANGGRLESVRPVCIVDAELLDAQQQLFSVLVV